MEKECSVGDYYKPQFVIAEEQAIGYIREADPSFIRITTKAYSLEIMEKSSFLVALNADYIVEYKIRIDDKQSIDLDKPDYEESCNEWKVRTRRLRMLQEIVNIILAISVFTSLLVLFRLI